MSFTLPDPRKPLSVRLRLRLSAHAKLATIVSRWQDRARKEGHGPEVIEKIDLGYVVGVLLESKVDQELAALGPSNDNAPA